jgi:hypothetical protein
LDRTARAPRSDPTIHRRPSPFALRSTGDAQQAEGGRQVTRATGASAAHSLTAVLRDSSLGNVQRARRDDPSILPNCCPCYLSSAPVPATSTRPLRAAATSRARWRWLSMALTLWPFRTIR